MSAAHDQPTIEAIPAAVRALLQARAERLKARLSSKAEDATLMVAQFRVDDAQYAIPLHELRAIVPLKLVTPVPLSPPHVVGILRYQGQVISALSLASMLGVSGWHMDPTVLIVLEVGQGKLVAFDSEEIPKPCPLPLVEVERARKATSSAIAELFIQRTATVHLLDVTALLKRGGWSNGQ
jgi:chemotaxis signal transduction protein